MVLLYRKRRHTNIFCFQEGSVWAIDPYITPLPHEALLSWGMRLPLSILRAGGLGPVCAATSLELSPSFWPLGESCQSAQRWKYVGNSMGAASKNGLTGPWSGEGARPGEGLS